MFSSDNEFSHKQTDDIEYPNISDIRMKDDSFESQTGRPAIDRNSKAAALSKYQTAQTKLEILDQQDKLMDKSIQNIKEIIMAEDELAQINDKEDHVADDEKDENLQHIKNKLLVLTTKHDDMVSAISKDGWFLVYEFSYFTQIQENNELKEQLDLYKEKERLREEAGELISAQEGARYEELAQRRWLYYLIPICP